MKRCRRYPRSRKSSPPSVILGLVLYDPRLPPSRLPEGQRWQRAATVLHAADPTGGNFQPTPDAIGSKGEVGGTAELVGDKIANYASSIAALAWSRNGRPMALLPFDGQRTMRSILQPPPAQLHSAGPIGEC